MTGLTQYLKNKGIGEIITVGVSTDYCMDATIKSGFEHGFKIIVPEFTNSTFDNPYFSKEVAYKYFNKCMWPGRYAEVVTMDKALDIIHD